jgi:hypothetical protein
MALSDVINSKLCQVQGSDRFKNPTTCSLTHFRARRHFVPGSPKKQGEGAFGAHPFVWAGDWKSTLIACGRTQGVPVSLSRHL